MTDHVTSTEDPMTSEVKKAGLFMCKVLRHNPDLANVTADAEGWVNIDDMVRGSWNRLTRSMVYEVAATNNKQRFAISEDGKMIRALQGHSFRVDLKLEPTEPPDVLYHGTFSNVVQIILRDGLKKMARNHVHMAVDTKTANSVGLRHGAPILFKIDAKLMHEMGHNFYRSENGVWLADYVPPDYLKRIPNDD